MSGQRPTSLRQHYAEIDNVAVSMAAAARRRVQFALIALILLFILALIALLKCKREDIPEVIRALAFWWRGWPRS
jgi:hypothetical protein